MANKSSLEGTGQLPRATPANEFFQRIARRARELSDAFRDGYALNVSIRQPRGIGPRFRIALELLRNIGLGKRLLFYPHRPGKRFIMYKICLMLGYRKSKDPKGRFDLAMKWSNDTIAPVDENLEKLAGSQKIINIECNDDSKPLVHRSFSAVFGYGFDLDPTAFRGTAVKKSVFNGLHDGVLIDCPIPAREKGFVYEKLINNETGDGLIEDIRIPIFRDRMPFAYLKYRPREKRFEKTNTKVILTEVETVLTPDEIQKVGMFCRKAGLEYGELDVLRDRDDGRIYIIDLNNIPGGMPWQISPRDERIAMNKMRDTFVEVFINDADYRRRSNTAHAAERTK